MDTRDRRPNGPDAPSKRRVENDDSPELLTRYLAELSGLPPLPASRVTEIAEELQRQEARFRAAIGRVPGTAVLVLERWRERKAHRRVTGLMAHEARSTTDCDWSAFIDERLGVLSRLVDRRRRSTASVPAASEAIDDRIASTLASAELLFEILHAIALEQRALLDQSRSRAFRDRRAELGLDERRARLELRRALQALARRDEARQTLAAHNLRLVVHTAKRYRGQGVPFLDLIQEGSVGLMRAVEKFDASLGYQFSTYAVWWIEQAMIRSIQRDSRTVRVPSHVYEARLRQRGAWQEVGARTARPGLEDVAALLDEPADDIEQTQLAFQQAHSLDAPLGDEARPLAERLSDPAPGPDEGIERDSLRAALERRLSGLDPREREVIELRFGLRDGEPLTLQQVGARIGRSRERVRQIEQGALESLRQEQELTGLRENAAREET